MGYNFVKNTYKSLAEKTKTDISVLNTLFETSDEPFLLKHNAKAFASALRFLESEDNIFVLKGAPGCGKTQISELICKFLDEKVILFKNEYSEAVNLDDVLLSVFSTFSEYCRKNKLVLPKTDVNVFSEKVNAFVKNADVPMFFVFDYFETDALGGDIQKDILDFINWLSKYSKVKIFLCSRTFDISNLAFQHSSVNCEIKPFDEDELAEYLESEKITGSSYELSELFKITSGNFLQIKLSVRIMQSTGNSLGLLLSEYKKSAKRYTEYLVSEILSFYSEKYVKPLLFTSVLRHAVSKTVLTENTSSTGEQLDFLVQNNLICREFDKYYMKDYTKTEFLKTVNYDTQNGIHKYVADLYESELPLKPFERKLFLSRLTMRKEIAYHTGRMLMLREETEKLGRSKRLADVSYLTYVKAVGYEENAREKKQKQKRYTEKFKTAKPMPLNLNEKDTAILNAIKSKDSAAEFFENISKAEQTPVPKDTEKETDNIPDSLKEFYDIAFDCEKKYKFSNAVTYYNKALTYKNYPDYDNARIKIYKRLAICYKNIRETDKALAIYDEVVKLLADKDPELACNALLKKAELYSEAYKFDKAKEIYLYIASKSQKAPDKSKIRAYLLLSDMLSGNGESRPAAEALKNALLISEKCPDIKLAAECSFKFGLLLDDMNKVDTAAKYYLRCIQTSKNPAENRYLASAYCNLAGIEEEKGNYKNAIKYYEDAIAADETSENNDGLYYEYSKLAQIYKNTDFDTANEYVQKMLDAANKTGDSAYILSAYTDAGSLYIGEKLYKKALKAFLSAKENITDETAQDIADYIEQNIQKAKKITGEVEFVRILNTVKNGRKS